MSALEIGLPAPSFSGVTQDGSEVSLESLRGKRVALYFYPRDNTSGCTKQACNLRDNYSSLGDAGIVIIGVSNDSIASHDRFAAKFELPFPLIADTEQVILEAYGVWTEKSMYGRKYMGTVRKTFLIDESGKLVAIISKPKVADHAREIIDGFAGA